MPYLTPMHGLSSDDPPPSTQDTDGWVIVARQTIQDGLCVEWFRLARAYENGGTHVISASRNGILVSGYLNEIPDTVLASAKHAHELLATRRDSDRDKARALATHEDTGPGLGRNTLRRIDKET